MSSSNLAIEAVSGATGAVIALIATYPLITVSTKQAVDKKSHPGSEYKPLSVLQEIFKIYEDEGAGGLFRGLQPGVVGTLISQGIYFYLYAAIRTLFVKPTKAGSSRQYQEISVGASLLTASIAGSANVLLTNPIWVVVTRMQTSSLSFRQVVTQLFDESEGLSAFWKGVVPSLVMVSNPTITYALYEWLVARWLTAKRAKAIRQYRSPQSVKLTGTEVFGLSACAKLGATVLTYPLLVVKNRMQVAKTPQDADAHIGTLQTIVAIYKGEGIWGFFKGIRAKMLQSILAAALLFMIKEQLQEASSAAISSIYKGKNKVDD